MNGSDFLDFNQCPESQLLGLCFNNLGYWGEVEGKIKPEWFHRHEALKVFKVFSDLYGEGKFNQPAILKGLSALSKDLAPSQRSFLGDVVSGPFSINLDYAIKELRDKHFASEQIRIDNEIAEAANSHDQIKLQRALDDKLELMATTHEVTKPISSMPDVFDHFITNVEENLKRGQGLSSGYKKLDVAIGGWHPGNVIILAARPGMGKSAVALNFAMNACRAGKHVAFFSLEMMSDEICRRIVSMQTGIENRKLRGADLSEDDLNRIEASAKSFQEIRGRFMPRSGDFTLDDIQAELRSITARQSLDLVVIDYLTLIRTKEADFNREREVATISRNIKLMANSLKLPIILIAQPNRRVEFRDVDSLPKNSDLRDSGQIEQDADLILWVQRKADENGTLLPETSIVITKNRQGDIGKIDGFKFDATSQTLSERN